MASSAAGASSACFSTTRLRPHNPVLKPAGARGPLLSGLGHFSEQLSATGVACSGNLTRISPVVAAEDHDGQAEGEVRLPQNIKLYIGNLPYNCDSSQLASLIGDYASPQMVEVMYDNETGKSRGFGFVTMNTTQACEAVISNLNGNIYDGRKLKVKFPERWKGKAAMCQESEFKLFVGNLSWSVTSETLKHVFKEYGDVVGARVLYDGVTGRSRGYGFVWYSNEEEMCAAIEALNGMELEGRALRISFAIRKKAPLIEEAAKCENN